MWQEIYKGRESRGVLLLSSQQGAAERSRLKWVLTVKDHAAA